MSWFSDERLTRLGFLKPRPCHSGTIIECIQHHTWKDSFFEVLSAFSMSGESDGRCETNRVTHK
jgi:hypothetical protein